MIMRTNVSTGYSNIKVVMTVILVIVIMIVETIIKVDATFIVIAIVRTNVSTSCSV